MGLFAMLLRDLRIKKRIYQKSVAHELGVHPSYLCRLERGAKNPPSESRRKRIYQVMKLGKEEIRLLELAATMRNPALEGLCLSPNGARHAVQISTAVHQAIPRLGGDVLDALQVLIKALGQETPQANHDQSEKEDTAAQ